MKSGKYVFYQITEFINRYEFNKCVKCYNGDLGVRDLDCWNQFLQLLFGQLSSLTSLRNICVCLKPPLAQACSLCPIQNSKFSHLSYPSHLSHIVELKRLVAA